MYIEITLLSVLCVVAGPATLHRVSLQPAEETYLTQEKKCLRAAHLSATGLRMPGNQDKTTESEILWAAESSAGYQHRAVENCQTLRQLEDNTPAHRVDRGEPEEDANLPTEKDENCSHINREPTRSEEVASLVSQLERIAAAFDDMILAHRRRIQGMDVATQSPKRAKDLSGWMTEPTAPMLEPSVGTVIGKQSEVSVSEMNEVEDRGGDDVLARQLREAAEIETDQILKEQLWNEYRKHKN